MVWREKHNGKFQKKKLTKEADFPKKKKSQNHMNNSGNYVENSGKYMENTGTDLDDRDPNHPQDLEIK
jgi:hypothetical protein